jgi:hypothetical protein
VKQVAPQSFWLYQESLLTDIEKVCKGIARSLISMRYRMRIEFDSALSAGYSRIEI